MRCAVLLFAIGLLHLPGCQRSTVNPGQVITVNELLGEQKTFNGESITVDGCLGKAYDVEGNDRIGLFIGDCIDKEKIVTLVLREGEENSGIRELIGENVRVKGFFILDETGRSSGMSPSVVSASLVQE